MALAIELRDEFRASVAELLRQEPNLSAYALLARLRPGCTAHRQAFLAIARDEIALQASGVTA